MPDTRARHDIHVSSAILGADLTPGEKLVYIAVRSRQGANDWCFASKRKLAQDIATSKSQITRCTRRLCATGWLEKSDDGRRLRCIDDPENRTQPGTDRTQHGTAGVPSTVPAVPNKVPRTENQQVKPTMKANKKKEEDDDDLAGARGEGPSEKNASGGGSSFGLPEHPSPPPDDDDPADDEESFADFLSEEQRGLYLPDLEAQLERFPTGQACDAAWSRIVQTSRQGPTCKKPVPRRWLIQQWHTHGWRRLLAAMWITAENADHPGQKYAHRVLTTFDEDDHERRTDDSRDRSGCARRTRRKGRRGRNEQPNGGDAGSRGRGAQGSLPEPGSLIASAY